MQKFIPVIILFFYCSTINFAQGVFQCQLTSTELQACVKSSSNKEVTEKAKKIYAPLRKKYSPLLRDTFPPINFDALKVCSNVKCIIAYSEKKKGQPDRRIIFYPAGDSLITSSMPDWKTKGLLLHAVAHLQLDHDSDATSLYDKEVEANERTAILLHGLGATYEQAILHLKETGDATISMPSDDDRLKVFKYIYNIQEPKITVTKQPVQKPEIIKPKPKQDIVPETFPNKWGIHAGLNYSPNFEKFSFTGGISFTHHPNWIGFQAELNYVNRIDGFSESYSFGGGSNYAYYTYTYDVHNIELPIMLIIGRSTERFGVNALLGASCNFTLLGDVDYEEYTSYANGSYNYYSGFYQLDFTSDDYSRLHFNGIAGITLGNNRFSVGSRVHVQLSDYLDLNPELRTYLMIRF